MFVFVTTCFNCEEFIERCIKSVLSQNYKEWSMYIIDDASQDDSVKIAKRFEAQDRRIRVIENKYNLGAVFNKTINFVRYADPKDEDVIITLDGDDYLIHESVLSDLAKVYQEDTWITYGGFQSNSLFNEDFYNEVDWSKSLRNQGFCLSHLRSHKFFLLKNVKYEDLCNRMGILFRYPEDVILFIPMVEMSGKEHAHFLKKPNYFYNVNLNSDSEDKERKAYINSIMADDLSFRKPYLTKTKEELVNGRCNWPKLEQLEITTHTKQI